MGNRRKRTINFIKFLHKVENNSQDDSFILKRNLKENVVNITYVYTAKSRKKCIQNLNDDYREQVKDAS